MQNIQDIRIQQQNMNSYIFIVLFACASAASCAVVAQVGSGDKVAETHPHVEPVVVDNVPVVTDAVVPVVPVVTTKEPVEIGHVSADKLKPISPDRVKDIIQTVHQHIPQVINHINKQKHQHVQQKGEVHDTDKVPHQVQQIVEHAHQHIPQVINHHVTVQHKPHHQQIDHVDHVGVVHAQKVPHTVPHHTTPHTVVGGGVVSTVATIQVHDSSQ